jgi:hypothetical protein
MKKVLFLNNIYFVFIFLFFNGSVFSQVESIDSSIIPENFLAKNEPNIRENLWNIFKDKIKNQYSHLEFKNFFDLFLFCEEILNDPRFIQNTDLAFAPTVHINSSLLQMTQTQNIPDYIKDFIFVKEKKVLHQGLSNSSNARNMLVRVPIHPLNTSTSPLGMKLLKLKGFEKRKSVLPRAQEYLADSQTPFRFTASRSGIVISENNQPLFGLKMGTNFINPNSKQNIKIDVLEDGKFSIERTKYMDLIYYYLGKNKSREQTFTFLREICFICNREHFNQIATGTSGYIIRDLNPLLNQDHLIIPAFSLPFFSVDFAAKNNMDVITYLKNNFAAPIGRAKAELALDLGLQMVTPNTQNILLRIDPVTFKVNRVIFRDLGDTYFVMPFIEKLSTVLNKKLNGPTPFCAGYGLEIKFNAHEKICYFLMEDLKFGRPIHPFANPNSRFSIGNFPATFQNSFEDLSKIFLLHVNEIMEAEMIEYVNTIDLKLGSSIAKQIKKSIDIRPFKKWYFNQVDRDDMKGHLCDTDDLDFYYIIAMENYFKSPEGQIKLCQYYQNNLKVKETTDSSSFCGCSIQ